MVTLSRRAFAAVIVAVGLFCGVIGALVALAIDSPDDPEVVFVDRVVEVPAAEPLAAPSYDDMERLVGDYLRLTSDSPDDPFANSLVDEIAVNVCEFAVPSEELFTWFERDLELSEAEFSDFYEEIAAVCPAE